MSAPQLFRSALKEGGKAQMRMKQNPHDDERLAAQSYPHGEKTGATSRCFCGGVEILVRGEEPKVSGFCHCGACRRAHASPLYQVQYWATSNVKFSDDEAGKGSPLVLLASTYDTETRTRFSTGELAEKKKAEEGGGGGEEGEDDVVNVTVVKGVELLRRMIPKKVKGHQQNKNDWDDNEEEESPVKEGRYSCKNCGTVMMNIFPDRFGYGVFPGTYTEKINVFAKGWQPKCHVNCESTILPLSQFHDGLKKLKEWGPETVV